MTKSTVAALFVVTAFGAGCAVPTEGEDPAKEALGTTSAAVVTTVGSGYAWVTTTGDLGAGWNSTGGAVTSAKLATGQYQVDFAGQTSANANAQVTAYGGTATHCKLFTMAVGSAYTRWIVHCYNSSGTRVDSAFNILTDHRTGSDYAGSAYLTSSSGGSVSDSFNSGGGTNTVSVLSTGVYSVSTPGTVSNNAVHVTAMGSDAVRCKIGSWTATTATVRCFNSSGAPANSYFSFSRRPGSLIDGQIGGHAWVDRGTLPAAYTAATGNCPQNPTEPFSVAADGNDMLVTLPDATISGGWPAVLPIVTAYGSSTNSCKVVNWSVSGDSTATARVRCFDNAGTVVNASSTQFDFTFTSKYFPFC